mgnify:CR=1 FL=1
MIVKEVYEVKEDKSNVKVDSECIYKPVPCAELISFVLFDSSSYVSEISKERIKKRIDELILELINFSKNQAEALIKVAILDYGENLHWITGNTPVNIENIDIEGVFNCRLDVLKKSNFKEMLRELNKKLSSKAFLKSNPITPYFPLIFFFTNGTDIFDKELDIVCDELNMNKWFINSKKIVVVMNKEEFNIKLWNKLVETSELIVFDDEIKTENIIQQMVTKTVQLYSC